MKIRTDIFEELNSAGLIPGGFSAVPDELRPQVLDEVRAVPGHEDDEQLPGQMYITDFPEYMPQQTTERRGRAETEGTSTED